MLIEQSACLQPFPIPNRVDEPEIRAQSRDAGSH
jgi:hypothetical protein